MMEVQQYLKTHSIAQLKMEYGINARVYEDDNLVLLDYDMIDTGTLGHKSHPLIIECRSLILSLDKFEVISRKFNRFFNAGECPDYYADFSFKNCIAYEKADGSLIGVYHNPYTINWEISTRGMAKAEGQHYMGKSFREMVIQAFGFPDEDTFQMFCDETFLEGCTYVFEYTSPLNKIVTPYTEDCMVLLDVTNKRGESVEEEYATDLRWMKIWGLSVRAARSQGVHSLDEALQLVEALEGLQEGFVLYDQDSGKRMKVKNSTYLVAHKLRGNDPVPTRKNILTLLFEGDVDEFLSYFPDFKQFVEPVQKEIDNTLAKIHEVWENAKHIPEQKDFALAVKDCFGSGVLFDARKTKRSPAEVFSGMDVTKKLRLFGV